jgi:hypothetical protein
MVNNTIAILLFPPLKEATKKYIRYNINIKY